MEDPLDTTKGRDSGRPWGGYRRRRAEGRPADEPAPTEEDWIESMKNAMKKSDHGASLGGEIRRK